MAQYALTAGGLTATTLPAQIGNSYHVGLSDGSRYYGYLFQNNGQQSSGFMEKSDVASKAALQNYGSPNLTDRDLSYYPRVTDGDFSGGGYQEVFLDPTKYFDSDLDPRVPGYLQLHPKWLRQTQAGVSLGADFQIAAYGTDFWYTFGSASGRIYSVNGANIVTVPTVTVPLALETDGTYLYVGGSSALIRTTTPTGAWTTVTTTLNGSATQWWVVNQGTNGYFAYYLVGTNQLYKIDLTAGFPVAAASQPQVPVGGNAVQIVDLVAFQNGLAILTNDSTGAGFDVWFHDGINLTRMVRVSGYSGQGLAACLGDLYVGAAGVGQVNSPILARVSSGQYQVVARPGSPFPTANQTCLGPRSASQFIYWPIVNPSIKGISNAPGIILRYDVMSGAVAHLPTFDTTDFTTTGGSLRALATLGDSIGIVYGNGTNGIAQYQAPAFGTINYQSAGWLCSSLIDFTTPGIAKRFRRVEVKHSPLNAGEAILVESFVDQDPLAFTTSITPTATSPVNTTVGSSVTALTFGADTVGKTMYFAVKLTAGTNQATSPRVAYVSTEIGGTRVWEFDLDCTSKRRLLSGASEDQQGITGKDLYYLIRNAHENGTTLTLYLAQSVTYSVAIESVEAKSLAYINHQNSTVLADQEWLVHVILRQVA